MSTFQAVGDVNSGRVRQGEALLLVSAIGFSAVGFFTHGVPVDLWAMIFWRNAFGSAALLIVVIATGRLDTRAERRFGWREWAIGACWSFGTICYIAAFTYTSVANISIIYAAAPRMMTAALAWFCIGERVSKITAAASVIALSGVALTVGGSAKAGTSFGDLLAFLMTLALSAVAVMARRRTYPALIMALASSTATSLIVLPLGWIAGARFTISGSEVAWLAAFGIITMAVALPCYLKGAAEVSAGRAMLICALEMPLAPLWVWLAFGEIISPVAWAGGLMVGVAIIIDVSCASTPAGS